MKVVFSLLLIISLKCILCFAGIPYIRQFADSRNPSAVILAPAENAATALAEGEWKEKEKNIYSRRPLDALEKDFLSAGYARFMWSGEKETDENGNTVLARKREYSVHDRGMLVYLNTDDASGYLTSASIEYTVSADRFSSTSMEINIPPLLDFIQIVTGNPVDEASQASLLRAFAGLFNDPGEKTETVIVNGLGFTISLDTVRYAFLLSTI